MIDAMEKNRRVSCKRNEGQVVSCKEAKLGDVCTDTYQRCISELMIVCGSRLGGPYGNIS